jgi:asparagine synthase (glutamine-hydrolysing)
MCGIAGVFHYRTGAPAPEQRIERMASRLVHRGPDQSGVFVDGELALGHRRLSIIDLSEAGRQPMTNEDGSVVISFNGEIYNFRDLRQELERAGHVFRSSSDTEVLVHLWEERGAGLFDVIVGQFAFALFDRRTRELVLARDRLGEKPLYWAPVPDGVVFASEIKAFTDDDRVDYSLDTAAVAAYLARQYVPPPTTAYAGIHALEPATFAVFRAEREPRFTRYWTPKPRTDLPHRPADRRELVEHEIDRVVTSRMVADVPVGCFLSGGLDSSLVAHAMRREARGTVQTFSIGFEERGYDESRESTQFARRLGVEHHVQIFRPPTFETLQSILQGYDQPFADPSAVPTYFLSRVARERVTVALSGDGGDEAFGGYERYRLMLLSGSLQRAPWVTQLGRAMRRWGGASMSAGRIAGRALVVAASPRVAAYASLMSPFGADTVRAWMPGVPPDGFERERAWFESIDDVSEAAQAADLTTYLPGCLTTKVDIASMANSLEVRAPFLDHRLLEIGLALPRRERVRLRQTKVLLRRIASERLGADVAGRPKKGFGVPLELWLAGSMRSQTLDYLVGRDARLPRLLGPAHVADETQRFFAGDRSRYFRMWTLLALEAWLRTPLGRRAVA